MRIAVSQATLHHGTLAWNDNCIPEDIALGTSTERSNIFTLVKLCLALSVPQTQEEDTLAARAMQIKTSK